MIPETGYSYVWLHKYGADSCELRRTDSDGFTYRYTGYSFGYHTRQAEEAPSNATLMAVALASNPYQINSSEFQIAASVHGVCDLRAWYPDTSPPPTPISIPTPTPTPPPPSEECGTLWKCDADGSGMATDKCGNRMYIETCAVDIAPTPTPILPPPSEECGTLWKCDESGLGMATDECGNKMYFETCVIPTPTPPPTPDTPTPTPTVDCLKGASYIAYPWDKILGCGEGYSYQEFPGNAGTTMSICACKTLSSGEIVLEKKKYIETQTAAQETAGTTISEATEAMEKSLGGIIAMLPMLIGVMIVVAILGVLKR